MSTKRYGTSPIQGDISRPTDFANTGLSIYTAETTQRHAYGRRYLTWDGRIYKYCLAAAAVVSYHGAGQSKAAVMTYEAVGAAAAAGAQSVICDVTGLTEDQLQGGHIGIYNASDVMQWRGIAGNDATVSTTTKFYLDAPLAAAITVAGSNAEIFHNPYRYCTHAADEYTSVICVPAVGAGSGYNFWGQTWGPCLISGGEAVDSPAAGARNLVFGANYVLFKNATKTSGQNAGFILNPGSASIAGPEIMLQISI
jgi:hypothetical protein